MSQWSRCIMQINAFAIAALIVLSLSVPPTQAALSKIPTAFSADGRFLLVQLNEVVLWDLHTKALMAKIPGLQCHQLVLMKQDGWLLCVGQEVTLYDWKNQAAVSVIPAEGANTFELLAYSRDADRLILRHGNEAVSVWQIGKKLSPLKHITLEASKDVLFLAASPDMRTLAIATGHHIQLHDLIGTNTRDVAIPEGKPRDLLFSPNSLTLAVSIGHAILLVDALNPSKHIQATVANVEEGKGPLTPQRFSQDSFHLVAGMGSWSYPLFDVETGKLVAMTEFTYTDQTRGVQAHTSLQAVDISDDAEYVVGRPGHPDTLQIWNVRTGTLLADLCGDDCRNMEPRVSLLKWSPTGSKVVVLMEGGLNSDLDGKLSVWDVLSRAPELVLDPSLPQAKALAKRVPPPATVVIAPSVTPAAPPSPMAQPAFAHVSTLRASAVSPTAPMLVTAGDEGLLKVWDPGQGKLLRQLALSDPVSALALSVDGSMLAAGTLQGDVRLWETQTWREFTPYVSRQGPINALQFLPGNRYLVVAGSQPKVSVVDLVTQSAVKELVHISSSQVCDAKGCVRTRAMQGEVVEGLSLLDGSPFLMTITRTSRVVWDLMTWMTVEKPAGLPESWSGLGWNRPFVWTMTRASAPNTFTLALWDTKQKKVLASLDTFTHRDTEIVDQGKTVAFGASMAVDPLQRWAATRVGESISIWDLASQAKRKTLHIKTPYHLHWTSDGKHLVVVTLDRKVLVWSAETMEPAHYLRDPAVMR